MNAWRTNTTQVHPTTERALRYRLRWIPAIVLGIAAIIQYSIWRPPKEIRWDGTLAEWPISWMMCCDSLIGFIMVLIAYLLAWAAFFALASGSPRYVVFTNLVLLIGFPVSIYAFMLWYYFQ